MRQGIDLGRRPARRKAAGVVPATATATLTPLRLAALDCGSNSFHLLVVEAHPDGTFDTLLREKEMLRLGDAVSRHGSIPERTVDRIVETARRFRVLAEGVGATEFVACATSALREAENSGEVIDRVAAEAGVRIEVISGKREARLVFRAVRASVAIDRPPALALDLGGGSLEVVVGDQGGLLWSRSVKLGVARLSAELAASDPLSGDDARRIRNRVTETLAPLADEIADFEPGMLVGTSGTFGDLARLATKNVAPSVHHVTVTRDALLDVHERLLSSTASERAKFPGLDARRADIAPAGSIVLVTAMELFGFDELTIGEWALREGAVLEAIERHDPVDWAGDARAVRRASVIGLARRCGSHEGHGRHVASLALDLFDQTLPLHRLASGDRELLEYAALVHDIGQHVAVEGHHKHTAYLIEHGRLRGFTPEEIAVLATLGRFHPRGEPKCSYAPYESLDAQRRTDTSRLLALLRIADALDTGHAGAVEGVDVELDSGRVRLRLLARTDVDLELWGVRRKRALFEKVFATRLETAA